ncbi:uncharacterized protein VTP21DRAFT_1710 [Calcarisporiella thermophila]|uniref:uncharacterized protein n=1 Tax=Calcarisporiella thermophila TaxID=911321 RepID=UPI00374459C2
MLSIRSWQVYACFSPLFAFFLSGLFLLAYCTTILATCVVVFRLGLLAVEMFASVAMDSILLIIRRVSSRISTLYKDIYKKTS